MAEQETEDPKIPAARRGPRPFVGPAGASQATRPLVRPAAPGNRPAPFAPPTPPDRSTLGTRSTPRSAPPLAAPIAPAIVPAPLAPEPVQATHVVTPVEAAIPAPTFDVAFTTESRESALPNAQEERPEAPVDAHAEGAPTVRPVTSEMVAIDAFDAFDAVWGSSEATAAPVPTVQTTPPLDEASLGVGVDAQHLWADEITSPPENVRAVTPPASHQLDIDSIGTEWTSEVASDPGMPAWLADDSSPPSAPAVGTTLDGQDDRAAAATPLLEASAAASPDAPAAPVSSGERWPDQLLAEYAPYIPTPSSVGAIKPQGGGVPQLPEVDVDATKLVAEPQPVWPDLQAHEAELEAIPALSDHLPESAAPTELAQQPAMSGPSGPVEPPVSLGANGPIESAAESLLADDAQLASWTNHGARVSAALDRLAERVRSGEIDVSSVAPEAPDAAILASVLAALLGGSSSR